MTISRALIVALAVMTMASACSGSEGSPTTPTSITPPSQPVATPAKVGLSITGPAKVQVNSPSRFEAVDQYDNNTMRPASGVQWDTSDSGLASIDQNGVLTPKFVSIGEFYVFARSGEYSARFPIIVEKDPTMPENLIAFNVKAPNMLLLGVQPGGDARIIVTAWYTNGNSVDVSRGGPNGSQYGATSADSRSPLPVAVNRDGFLTPQRAGTSNIAISFGGQFTIISVEAR